MSAYTEAKPEHRVGKAESTMRETSRTQDGLNGLSERISDNARAIDRLRERLAPVLPSDLVDDPQAKSILDTGGMSPVVSALAEFCSRLSGQIDELNKLNQQLQV
jgi:hypothetical protein